MFNVEVNFWYSSDERKWNENILVKAQKNAGRIYRLFVVIGAPMPYMTLYTDQKEIKNMYIH